MLAWILVALYSLFAYLNLAICSDVYYFNDFSKFSCYYVISTLVPLNNMTNLQTIRTLELSDCTIYIDSLITNNSNNIYEAAYECGEPMLARSIFTNDAD